MCFADVIKKCGNGEMYHARGFDETGSFWESATRTSKGPMILRGYGTKETKIDELLALSLTISVLMC